jgi:glutamyl-tRNA synthetase
VGGARTALFCWAFAKGRGGTFLLRIEDTDQKRSSGAASVGFLKDLAWLGIDWDEGPQLGSCGGGANGPYFQSERLDTYNRVLAKLVDEGKAYYAFDTAAELEARRAEAKAAGRAYRYDGTSQMNLPKAEVERRLAAGEPAVIRLKCPPQPITIKDEILGEATLPAGEVDDFVLPLRGRRRRRDDARHARAARAGALQQHRQAHAAPGRARLPPADLRALLDHHEP